MLLPLTWNWKETRPRRRTRRYHLVLFYLLIDTFCGMKKKMFTLKNKYGRQKPIVHGLEGVGLGGSVLRLNPECRILNPENTVPDPHNWRYAKSIPPQIAIEQNRRTERKKNKMGTKKMKLQLKIVFRINSPHHADVYKFSQLCGALSPLT